MKIVTHSGSFHPDEIFGVATLLLKFKEDRPEVIRSREETDIASGDFVLDVGGKCDGEKHFDHHQGGISPRENGIPYASFGLVWKRFGGELSGSEEVAAEIEKTLVCGIDAKDNGINIEKSLYGDVFTPPIWDTMMAARPTWKEEASRLDEIFSEQVDFAKRFLARKIKVIQDKKEGNEIVEGAYQSSADKRIIVLEKYMPWGEVLSSHPEPLFAVYQSLGGDWHVQAVRSDLSTYSNRKDFPENWAGKRDAELAAASGVPDAVFCHRGRFIIVARSREGAVKLAELAVNA